MAVIEHGRVLRYDSPDLIRGILRSQTETASERIASLIRVQEGVIGVRVGMVNDWGSATGFSYTMGFVREGDADASDERIDLCTDTAVYIERKALWVGEGGLVGATLDLDDDFNLCVVPKDADS